MPQIVALQSALDAPADQAPEWVQLVPAGRSVGVDGRGPYILRDPQAVIAASLKRGRFPLDENHATEIVAKTGGASPARGWVVEMQSRADGLWGRVEWTPEGKALVAGRAYRDLSPAIVVNEADGTVLRVKSVALTNDPNLALASLHHQQGTGMDLAKLRAVLGLPETADEAAILAAATAAHSAVQLHAAERSRIAKAAGAPEDANAEAIVVALQSRAAEVPATVRQEMVALQSRVNELTTERAREVAERAVDAAIDAGKPIPTALRQHYIDRHMKDAASVQTELDGLPALNHGGLGGRRGQLPAGAEGLSGDDVAVTGIFEVTPEAYRKRLEGSR
jgi:phage I-like protein